MAIAQMFGGPRDGTVLTLSGPLPGVVHFPEAVPPASITDAGPDPLALGIIAQVDYRLRPMRRCCASWCTFPSSCTCCPRCSTRAIVYDYVRPR